MDSIDPVLLSINLFFGMVGMGYFLHGRKRKRWSFLSSGIVLMGYSYFTDSLLLIVIIGLFLVIVPFFVKA